MDRAPTSASRSSRGLRPGPVGAARDATTGPATPAKAMSGVGPCCWSGRHGRRHACGTPRPNIEGRDVEGCERRPGRRPVVTCACACVCVCVYLARRASFRDVSEGRRTAGDGHLTPSHQSTSAQPLYLLVPSRAHPIPARSVSGRGAPVPFKLTCAETIDLARKTTSIVPWSGISIGPAPSTGTRVVALALRR